MAETNLTEEKILDRIKQLRLSLLIHSVIYYRMFTNIISDYEFDMRAKELKKLQDEHPELSKRVPHYYKEFMDWNGCSGYDLPLGDPWACRKAKELLETHRMAIPEGAVIT